jgi:hypothetical protein
MPLTEGNLVEEVPDSGVRVHRMVPLARRFQSAPVVDDADPDHEMNRQWGKGNLSQENVKRQGCGNPRPRIKVPGSHTAPFSLTKA